MKSTHINNNTRPLIFLGTSANMTKLVDICDQAGIKIAGIIDNDYYGNTKFIQGIPVIDSEENINQYQDCNFFCAVNWLPANDPVLVRNRDKRKRLIDLIDSKELNCISLVDSYSRVSSTATIGRGVYIDAFVLVESLAEIHDYVSIYAYTGIGHHTIVERNTVIQRHCSIAGGCVFEHDTFIGTAVKALKTNAVFGFNTFIHEGIYIRRGTIPDEIVSLNGGNRSRVYNLAEDTQFTQEG